MKSRRENNSGWLWLALLIVAIVITGISYLAFWPKSKKSQTAANKDTKLEQPSAQPEVKANEAPTGTVIKTGNSQYGPMLFDSRGQAIYIWQLEDSSTAECYGNCAEEWPPVLTNGTPIAAGDVKSELLATTTRTDGATQVTYNGHPLYFYAHEGVGQVECHNVKTHGGLWWVIQPNGMRAP